MLNRELVELNLQNGKKLILFNIGLVNCDIISLYGNLQYINLMSNAVQSLGFCKSLYRLKELYVENNKIRELVEIDNLLPCKCLIHLSLSENPICDTENYYYIVINTLRMIVSLDERLISVPDRRTAQRLVEDFTSEIE